MRAPTFNFVPERQVQNATETGGYRVSLASNGTIYFPKDVLDIYELDGKYIQMFVDIEKKAIGWKMMTGEVTTSELLAGCRIIKRNQAGAAILGITKLMSTLGLGKMVGKRFIPTIKLPIKDIRIEKYKSEYLSDDIYYFSLKDYIKPLTTLTI